MKHIKKTVFYVDDEPECRNFFEQSLEGFEFQAKTFENGYLLMDYIRCGNVPNVVLLNLHLPGIDGFETAKQIKEINSNIPLIAVISTVDPDSYKKLFENNFHEVIFKPFDPEVIKVKIKNAIRTSHLLNSEQIEYMLMLTFANLEQLRDPLTRGHNYRMGLLSGEIVKELGCSSECYECIKVASSLHDIGKHIIPDHIINKPGKLDVHEMAIMKTHTTMGHRILSSCYKLNIESMLMAAEIALKHHEKLDGSGYPYGITKEDIPPFVRVVTIADILDACTMKRPYHQERSIGEGFDILREELKNETIDKKIFNTVLKMKDKIKEINILSSVEYEVNDMPVACSVSGYCSECFNKKKLKHQ
jgi:putative two-component system response regulator